MEDVLLITKTKGKPKERDIPIKSDLIKDWQICKTALYLNDRITKELKELVSMQAYTNLTKLHSML